jgi:DNA-directed RNA polymerase subunit alpha
MISKSILNYPSIKATLEEISQDTSRFIVEPLLHGYGYTLGNSLRRLILSSIPGYAVTAVKINDLTHEYQSIDGVVEDVVDVILNLKNLRVKILTDDDTVSIKLNKSSAGEVTAKDFAEDGKVEIINKDLFICYLSKDIDLDIEIDISRGVGYLSTDKIDYSGNIDPQKILIDAVFSPVFDVSLKVEQVRVGDKTDYDKLILDFKTDGTISGKEVINLALSFTNDLFLQIASSLELSDVLTFEEGKEKLAQLEQEKANSESQISEEKISKDDDSIKIEDETVLAILEKNEIFTNQDLIDLIKNREEDFNNFPGLKKKHIKLVHEYVKSL